MNATATLSMEGLKLMNPVTLLKITFAFALVFTFASTLYALFAPSKKI